MARTSAAEKYPYLPSSVTNFNYELPKDNSQKATKDRVYGYTTLNSTQQAQQKAENIAANIDPRITQRQNQTVYTPPASDSGSGGDIPVVPTGGSTVGSNPYESYYNKMASMYEKQLAEEKARQEQLRQARINAANTVYNTSKENLNNATDSSLRQAYIKHMQDQKALPQQMQAFGMSGGATETTLANMKNAYGNNRTSIMNENLAQQRLIEQDRANAIANAEADAANYEASAVRDYNNGLINLYQSALSNVPKYNNVGTTSQITKNPWYDVAVGYLEDGNDVNSVITALKEQGVSEDIIDAILYNWESTI